MTYAVLRIRSPAKKKSILENVLKYNNLRKVNHCRVFINEDEIKSSLKKVKDLVTWGELNSETLEKMLKHRASIEGGLTDEMVSERSDHESVSEFAEAVVNGEADISDIDGLKNLFRLHPPRGGYKGVKKPYNTGGSLGYRGKEINSLLSKMLGPEIKDE